MPIYMDYQSTTPVDPRVKKSMLPYLDEEFGNPHSVTHKHGNVARKALDNARNQIADSINASSDEIIFTSGATESCNLAIRGLATPNPTKRKKIISVATEHPAVRNTILAMKNFGYQVSLLPVQEDGLLDLNMLENTIDDDTLLVSVMLINNETGVIQNIAEIAGLCRNLGIIIHTDATQGPARTPIDVEQLGIDLLSLSSHKVYGPKGVGILYKRSDSSIHLTPIFTGGGQESGIRSGTIPVHLAVGFGEAMQLSSEETEKDAEKMTNLANKLFENLMSLRQGILLFGSSEYRAPGNLYLGFPGIPAEQIINAIAGEVSLSVGSSCASAEVEPSPILLAMGFSAEIANTALRISLGRFTTLSEIEQVSSAFCKIFNN